jgi:hypothetical protein
MTRTKTRRFWKPRRSLPSVEWDPEAGSVDPATKRPTGKARFEFVRGLFETDDEKLADELLERGYCELHPGETPPPILPQDDVHETPTPENPGFTPMEPGTAAQLQALGIQVPTSGP